jgi:hypothetical protein
MAMAVGNILPILSNDVDLGTLLLGGGGIGNVASYFCEAKKVDVKIIRFDTRDTWYCFKKFHFTCCL